MNSPKRLAELTRLDAVPPATDPKGPQETWPMTLAEALHVGLDNSERVRVYGSSRLNLPVGGQAPAPIHSAGSDRSSRGVGMIVGQRN